jgi:hypothetical protein
MCSRDLYHVSGLLSGKYNINAFLNVTKNRIRIYQKRGVVFHEMTIFRGLCCVQCNAIRGMHAIVRALDYDGIGSGARVTFFSILRT